MVTLPDDMGCPSWAGFSRRRFLHAAEPELARWPGAAFSPGCGDAAANARIARIGFISAIHPPDGATLLAHHLPRVFGAGHSLRHS